MFKQAVVIFALIACTAAKPGLIGAPLAYHHAPAALVAAAPAPFITATSSQVIARNYNGIAHAPIVATAPVAKIVAPVAAPLAAAHVAAPLATAHIAAPLAYSSPVVAKYAAAHSLAYSSPFAANYVASPYAAAYAPSFASPLHYSYASSPLIL